MGQSTEIQVNRWIWEAYPAALSLSEMLQFAFHDMSDQSQEAYPQHLEPALQRAMLYHLSLPLQ